MRYRTLSAIVCALFLLSAACLAQVASQAGQGWDKIVNVEFKGAEISGALEALFKDSGLSYTIDSDVRGMSVTAVLRNVTLRKALEEIAKAAGAQFRIENDVVSITSRTDRIPRWLPPTQVGPPNSPGTPAGPRETRVVQLSFLNPGDIASLFWQGPGQAQVMATSGGKLIVSGTKEEADRALDLIKSLDTESALARPIRISVDVAVTAAGTERRNLSTMSVGAEGGPMLLDISSELAEDRTRGISGYAGSPYYDRRPSMLRLALTPTVDSAGRVSIAGNGRFEMTFPLPGDNAKEFHQVSKDIQVAASLEPGKPQSIASGTVDTPAGKASFDVQVTATIEKGRVPVPPQGPRPGQGYGGYGGGGGYGGRGYDGGYGSGGGGGYPPATGYPRPPAGQ